MDWRNLPSLGSLRAFAALAETGSFTKAGGLLNVSHAAVSQQVRALEAHVGTPLVQREGRGMALTPEGEDLARSLERGFSIIGGAIDLLADGARSRPLQVTMTPSFAVSWLMPRIADFRQRHPEVELVLMPTSDIVELAPGGVDVALRFGDGRWPGLEAELLLPTNFVVVAARALVGDRETLSREDLASFPWLQELGTDELTRWQQSQGVLPSQRLNITHLPGYMMLEGLRRGEGISATARAFVEEDIAAGTLRVLYEDPRPNSGYYIVTRPGVMRPPLKAFARWLKTQADGTRAAPPVLSGRER